MEGSSKIQTLLCGPCSEYLEALHWSVERAWRERKTSKCATNGRPETFEGQINCVRGEEAGNRFLASPLCTML
jgi:hypothetical protein